MCYLLKWSVPHPPQNSQLLELPLDLLLKTFISSLTLQIVNLIHGFYPRGMVTSIQAKKLVGFTVSIEDGSFLEDFPSMAGGFMIQNLVGFGQTKIFIRGSINILKISGSMITA